MGIGDPSRELMIVLVLTAQNTLASCTSTVEQFTSVFCVPFSMVEGVGTVGRCRAPNLQRGKKFNSLYPLT